MRVSGATETPPRHSSRRHCAGGSAIRAAVAAVALVVALPVGADELDDLVAEARRLYTEYGSSARGRRGSLAGSISRLLGRLEGHKDEPAVRAISAFFDYPEFDTSTTDALVEIDTKSSRGAILEVLKEKEKSRRSGRNLPTAFREACRRARILARCSGLSKSFSSSALGDILSGDSHEEVVKAVLDFLEPRIYPRAAAAVLDALNRASPRSGLGALEKAEAEDLFVGFFARGLAARGHGVPGTGPAAGAGEKGKADEKRKAGGKATASRRPLTDEEVKEIYGHLLEHARNKSRRVIARTVAMRVLGRQKQKALLEVLRSVLDEEQETPRIVTAAARAAVGLGDPAAGPWFLPVLKKWTRRVSKNPLIEEDLVYLIEAIYPLKMSGAAPYLLKVLKSKKLYLRSAAIVSVPVLGETKAASHLKKALSSRHWRIRLAGIEACRRMRSAVAVDLLIDRLEKENGRLQFDLLMALHDLTGVVMPYVSADWKKWWKTSRAAYRPPDPDAPRKDSGTVVLFPEATKSTYFGLRVLSKRLAFVCDVSGSMSAEMEYDEGSGSRIDFMKNELIRLVKTFRKGTYFNVYFFSTAYNSLFKQLVVLTRGNYKKVQGFVRTARASGGTNLFDPLEKALEDPYVDTIYLLSDGDPTSGKHTKPGAILRAVRKINRRRGIQINAISIGKKSDLLRKLAQSTGGDYRVLK
ncbi:MAG: VWA domain-containing protein [Planctomycetota bacterium]|nr:VWA domain-containing protein [Planctomycetota bacterium]